MHKIVSGGRIVSGCSCYATKNKIIMGIVVLLTRDPQLRKSIYVVDKIAIPIEFDYQCHCLVMEQTIGIVLSEND